MKVASNLYPAGRACSLPDEAACRRWKDMGVTTCVVVATGGGPGFLGKGRAGSGSGPAETDDTQPREKGQTDT